MRSFILLMAAAAATVSAQATTTLYVPGFDPQPLQADVLGVDNEGQTTYAIHAGTATGEEEAEFPGTATLVLGPEHVHLTYENAQLTMGRDCSLKDGVAYCSGVFEGETLTESETISPILVQVGSTAVPAAPTGSVHSAEAQPSQSSSGKSPSGSVSPTGNPSSPQPSNSGATFNANGGYALLLIATAFIVAQA